MNPADLAATMPWIASSNTPGRSAMPVVRRFHAVEMHVHQQPAAGAKAADLLRQQRAVGAEINVFPPQDEALDQHFDFRIDQRLAAADAHDRRPALVDGRQALLDRQPRAASCRRIRGFVRSRRSERLQACSGSSIKTSGNFFSPAKRLRSR